ncbi:MAG: hypothetical protein O2856_12220 [Planctomycetota bacterium]|nr:hypothetical protein [Planctomycetota bacterium]
MVTNVLLMIIAALLLVQCIQTMQMQKDMQLQKEILQPVVIYQNGSPVGKGARPTRGNALPVRIFD